jgi:hypothetical protein
MDVKSLKRECVTTGSPSGGGASALAQGAGGLPDWHWVPRRKTAEIAGRVPVGPGLSRLVPGIIFFGRMRDRRSLHPLGKGGSIRRKWLISRVFVAGKTKTLTAKAQRREEWEGWAGVSTWALRRYFHGHCAALCRFVPLGEMSQTSGLVRHINERQHGTRRYEHAKN